MINHTALLSDACHPVLTFSFSGISMRVKNGVTLSILLSFNKRVGDIEGSLELYGEIRIGIRWVMTMRKSSFDVAKRLDDRTSGRSTGSSILLMQPWSEQNKGCLGTWMAR